MQESKTFTFLKDDLQFSKYDPGARGVPKTFRGPRGESYFHNNVKTWFALFLLCHKCTVTENVLRQNFPEAM